MKRLEEAEKEFRTSIQLDPTHWPGRIGLAEVLSDYADIKDEEDMYEEALEELNLGVLQMEKAFNVDSDDQSSIYNLRGYIYTKLRKFTKAKKDFQKSLALDVSNYKAKRNLRRIKKNLATDKVLKFVEYGSLFFSAILSSLSLWLIIVFVVNLKEAGMNLGQIQIGDFATNFAFLFLFAIVTAFLPKITRLKIGTVIVEKDVSSMITIQTTSPKVEK